MNLIIFDIDGTIIDSIESDDACFVQSFYELFDLDLKDLDWDTFKNITDSGLTYDIFHQFLNRAPELEEISLLKNRYYDLLQKQIHTITEIDGAADFINYLVSQPNYTIAFATGGWKKTALLKAQQSNIDITRYTYKTADDHYNRAQMLQLAIDESRQLTNVNVFDSIISFGDGLWDMTTADELGVAFIGVDYNQNHKLRKAGVQRVIRDYKNFEELLNWI